MSFYDEDVHYARKPLSPQIYMEMQFPEAADLVFTLMMPEAPDTVHGWLQTLTSENCNLPKSLGGLAILKTFLGITHVSKVSSLLTARLVAWCLTKKPWKRSARK